jgi:hypothetical protein
MKVGNKPQAISPSQVSSRQEPSTPRAAEQAKSSAGPAKAGWTPGAGKAARAPAVAPEVTDLALAFKAAGMALSQMDMVAGSVNINNKADALLMKTATELGAQLQDRGMDAKAVKVVKDLAKFFTQVGPAKGYRMDPERGTMASLEDNGDRLTKVMKKLGELANQLDRVNQKPVAEGQQLYNRQAYGESVEQQARLAIALEEATQQPNGDQKVSSAIAFLKALPAKIDASIESRGGSLEPLERWGGTASALEQFTGKLASS